MKRLITAMFALAAVTAATLTATTAAAAPVAAPRGDVAGDVRISAAVGSVTAHGPKPAGLTATDLAMRVVYIETQLGGRPACSGSGTIIEPDGTILTNSHVIEQASDCPYDRIAIGVLEHTDRPPELRYEAEVLVDDPLLDLAVIRIVRTLDGRPVTESFPTIGIGDSDQVALGDHLDVIGYPSIGGDTVTYTGGTVSGFVPFPDNHERAWIKTDTTIAGGNSGGLAADTAGRIVGVPTRAGTGDGRITDCRVVADTNRDGRIDHDDACVPIGGFINGIRPINTALPLIEAARIAAPMTLPAPMTPTPAIARTAIVENPVWTLGVTSDGTPVEPVLVAPIGTPELCLVWDYDNVPPNSAYRALWYVDGSSDPQAMATGTTPDTEDGHFSTCISSAAGLPGAVYELAWMIDDVRIFSEATVVDDGRAAVDVDVVNALAEDICVLQLSLAVAQTYGMNRIAGPLANGETASLTLPTGNYDMRVIDCDGLVVVEQVGGRTVVDIDHTITLSPR